MISLFMLISSCSYDFFWIFTHTDEISMLSSQMEKLARSQYLIKKDPKDCALLYLALNRVQVLAGLFKIGKDERDRPLVGFLSRNFQVLWHMHNLSF